MFSHRFHCRIPEFHLCFPIREIQNPERTIVSYLRETCGKPWVSMWLPLCVLWVIRISLYFPSFFPFETRDFNVVFHLCLCRKLHVSPMKPDRTKTFSFRGNHVPWILRCENMMRNKSLQVVSMLFSNKGNPFFDPVSAWDIGIVYVEYNIC